MESVNTIYRISINPVPELINSVPMYFWCILGQHSKFEANCAHGWADSILSAAKEAQHYYETIINPHSSSLY